MCAFCDSYLSNPVPFSACMSLNNITAHRKPSCGVDRLARMCGVSPGYDLDEEQGQKSESLHFPLVLLAKPQPDKNRQAPFCSAQTLFIQLENERTLSQCGSMAGPLLLIMHFQIMLLWA